MKNCLLIVLLVLLLAGCVELYRPAAAPSGLAATTDEIDRIVLTWNEVSFAAAYAVYRSVSEDGVYDWIGSVTALTYIDIDVGPEIEYWYSVASLSYGSSDSLSPVLSAPVRGTSVHDFTWSISSVDFDAEFIRLAADTEREGYAYAATSLSGESEISIHLQDGLEWTTFDISPGTVSADSAESAPFAITSYNGGTLVAFADRSNGDRLTVRSAESNVESVWTTLGTEGFADPPSGAIEAEIMNDTPIVVSMFATSPLVQALAFDGTSWQPLGDLTASLSGRTSEKASVAARNATAILAIEDSVPTPSLVVLYEYSDGSGWTEIATLPRSGDAELVEMSIAATESLIYLATLDASAGLIVSRFDGSSWINLGFPLSADPSSEALAIGVEDSRVVLFSRDATTLEGVVSEYDGDWSMLPQSEDTVGLTSSLNLRQLRIDVFANRIFAGYVNGTAFGSSASVGIYH